MAYSNIWFDGAVSEGDHAQNIWRVGKSRYGVVSNSDWAVTIKAGTDRTVNIAKGVGWGSGVVTETTTTETVTVPSPSGTSTRWDLIVMRRNWSGAGGSAVLTYVTGSSSKSIPSNRNKTPGGIDDQPLALIRVQGGQSNVLEVFDLRVWGENRMANTMCLDYIGEPGATAVYGDTLYVCNSNGNWAIASRYSDTGVVNGFFAPGWGQPPTPLTPSDPAGGYYAVFRKAALGSGFLVEVRLRFYRNGANINVPTTGDVANQLIGAAPAGFAPTSSGVGMHSGAVGRAINGYIETNGDMKLTTAMSNGADINIEKGDAFQLFATYMRD